MAKKREAVKINKKHGGKEFKNFWIFVGKLDVSQQWNKDTNSFDNKKIYEEKLTGTGKPRRTLLFDLHTDKFNRLKLESWGMQNDFVYAYSSTEDNSFAVEWKDRFDKSKLPNETYHLSESDWDKVERFGVQLEEALKTKKDVWIKVTGRYDFDSYTYENKTTLTRKRMVNEIEFINDGDIIKFAGKEVKYITNFDDPNFVEVNYFNAQIGIRSTYQDSDSKSTKVNAVSLGYGKERSTPKDLEMVVHFKDPSEGEVALSDAFANLNRYDFVKVYGVDHNRAEVATLPVEVKTKNPFANVGEKVEEMRQVTTGTIKDLEITGIFNGSYVEGFLTEDEITVQQNVPYNPFVGTSGVVDETDYSDLPF